MRPLLFAIAIALTGCTAGSSPPAERGEAALYWSYDALSSDVREQSCPEGVSFQRPDPMPITASEVELGDPELREEKISGMALSGVWHLTTDNDEFGGLSGLDVLSSGSLLAVTDDGKFVWIGIDPETGAPDGIGSIAFMRDRNGEEFPTKRSADAEDLVVRDGIAFVSFEQDHRISAYDLETCGVAAHAALVVRLIKVVDRYVLQNNRGAEALAFVGDTLAAGFEVHSQGGSPIGHVRVDGTLGDLRRTSQPGLFLLTGMDASADLMAYVFRSYDPIRKSRIIVRVDRGDERIANARLESPLPVDNIEAIAIGTSPSGDTRLWLLSDDNFNDEQRTLLMALDLTE
ncbi:MAG: esterase-like activity of phytase family protein [Pseudomonadota bacterium]